jgi:hypothetical protein
MGDEKTIISIEQHGNKHYSELSWDAGIDDILDSFYGLCVAASFEPKHILEYMKDWSEERLNNME